MVPRQRLFSASGCLLPSPEVSLTHSVFREMPPLSPHCSLILPNQPVPIPPLHPWELRSSFVQHAPTSQTKPLWRAGKGLGKNPRECQNKYKKGSLDQPECQPHPGVWDKHGQVFVHHHSAYKYLFLFVSWTHSHRRCMPDTFLPKEPGLTSVCRGRAGRISCLQGFYKYARISSNLMSTCRRMFLFGYLDLHTNALLDHSSIHPPIYPHACTNFYIYMCVCVHMHLHIYIYPPTFTQVWIQCWKW